MRPDPTTNASTISTRTACSCPHVWYGHDKPPVNQDCPQHGRSVVGRKTVSEPGAALKVDQVELSEAAKRGLTTTATQIPLHRNGNALDGLWFAVKVGVAAVFILLMVFAAGQSVSNALLWPEAILLLLFALAIGWMLGATATH